jgi:hypothetical protein
MAQMTHPHAEATYRVIPIEDGLFAVEVSIPAQHPATVSPFTTEADAEAWITEHRRRVQSEGQQGSGFRKRGGRPRKVEQPPRDDE